MIKNVVYAISVVTYIFPTRKFVKICKNRVNSLKEIRKLAVVNYKFGDVLKYCTKV